MEGQRVAKGGGSKLPLIVTGTVAGLLAAAYLGVCAWASGKDEILPNVSVAGIDVSNMLVEQAQDTVEAVVAQRSGQISFTLSYEGLEESLNGSDVKADVEQSIQNARQIGHENFFTSGFQLLSHMAGASSQLPLEIPEDDPAVTGMLDRMKQAVTSRDGNHAYAIKGDRLEMTKGAPVATMDWETAQNQVLEHLQSAFQNGLATESGKTEGGYTLTPTQSKEGEEPDFEAIHRELYAEPKDASLDLESMEITDHVVGVDFDVKELQNAYRQAKGGETFSIPVELTLPKVTKEDLGGQLFKDMLGESTSRVTGVASRLYNVTLSANSCNGVIVLPGEVFSYNDTTGPRSVANGYRLGSVYVGGKSEQQPGGGVCQTSSTLYHAILHTQLEIVERRCHQFAVGYVPDGMDATVYDGGIDFKFRNNTDYPIKILSWTYDNSKGRFITVQIYGTNPDGIYAVPSNSVFDVVAPTTVYEPKESVPRGELILDTEQYAYRGRKARTWRTTYNADGTKIETQEMGSSSYKMRPNTYFYNPADGDPTTWVNGKPPADPSTTAPVDPGTTTPVDPGTTAPVDPGTTPPDGTDPGTTAPVDPGVTPPVDPGVDPGADPGIKPPVDPGTTAPVEPAPPPPSDSGLKPIDPNTAAG